MHYNQEVVFKTFFSGFFLLRGIFLALYMYLTTLIILVYSPTNSYYKVSGIHNEQSSMNNDYN